MTSRNVIICKCGAQNVYYYEPYKACLKCNEPFKARKKRRCGNCGKTGHNKATCNKPR